MKRLNVLPKELSGVKMQWWRQDPTFLLSLRGCVVLLICSVAILALQRTQFFFYERFYENRKSVEKVMKSKLLEEERKFALVRSSIDGLNEEQNFLDKKQKFLNNYQSKEPVWSEILMELSQMFSKRIQLRKFHGTKDGLTIQGIATDHRSVNSLIQAMSESGLDPVGGSTRFRNVRLNFTEIERKDDFDTLRFEIAADIA
ncbi:MAG: PilN domain-containing protein [Candidatus Omnitrophica bacterium]|nr:PilN domain-containing protein [Candidatus Omnitrophota bacterium]